MRGLRLGVPELLGQGVEPHGEVVVLPCGLAGEDLWELGEPLRDVVEHALEALDVRIRGPPPGAEEPLVQDVEFLVEGGTHLTALSAAGREEILDLPLVLGDLLLELRESDRTTAAPRPRVA